MEFSKRLRNTSENPQTAVSELLRQVNLIQNEAEAHISQLRRTVEKLEARVKALENE